MSQAYLSWREVLGDEKRKPYFQDILAFLEAEKNAGKTIYPPKEAIFQAFKETPYEQVKVVILGQDPYHGPNQAHGLSFSVKPGTPAPPSLKNIFRALNFDLGLPIPPHGCLEKWAQQGVLLLNTSLSVEQGKPQSHAKIGWHTFTDTVIQKLNAHPQALVFLLWGGHAKSKAHFIDHDKHLILTTVHPSPLSAHQGFLTCRHFSQANDFLMSKKRSPIDWQL